VQEEVIAGIKRTSLAVLQVAVASSPVVAKLSGASSVVWPPLGTISDYVAPVATAVIALFSIVPDVLVEKQTAKKWFVGSLVSTLVCLIVYAVLVGGYVVTVQTPDDGPQTRSVGFIVQPMPQQLYPHASFATLLLHGGLDEDRIETTWTPNSVLAARLCLLTFLSLTLASINVALGAAAYVRKRPNADVVLPESSDQQHT
jgi:hypothetical protein